MVVKEEKQEPM